VEEWFFRMVVSHSQQLHDVFEDDRTLNINDNISQECVNLIRIHLLKVVQIWQMQWLASPLLKFGNYAELLNPLIWR
jgi:hypothetical protein